MSVFNPTIKTERTEIVMLCDGCGKVDSYEV
jgi:hypothetical protein